MARADCGGWAGRGMRRRRRSAGVSSGGASLPLLLLLLLLLVPAVSAQDVDDAAVTCGSMVKLREVETRDNLHSHKINWGSGSRQQSVTAHSANDDQDSLWLVKERHGSLPCEVGTPVKCGERVRLEHVNTGKNLHTHKFSSPLSRKQEVSAYGNEGEGDGNDDWEVVCGETPPPGEVTNHYWLRGEKFRVRLLSVSTKAFMGTSPEVRFTQKNCPNCPIIGQGEVACDSQGSWWYADQGVFLLRSAG